MTTPLIATVQVQTSKSDAIIKLQVLDAEEEMVSTIGKGHAVIPAFNFISAERPLSGQCKYYLLHVEYTKCHKVLQ